MRRLTLVVLLLGGLALFGQGYLPQATPRPHKAKGARSRAATVQDIASPTPSPSPAKDDQESQVRIIRVIAGILVVGGLYFMPTIVGFSRHHHNRGAIFALNLLLGWSVVGWIAAFIWAFTNPPPPQHYYYPPPPPPGR